MCNHIYFIWFVELALLWLLTWPYDSDAYSLFVCVFISMWISSAHNKIHSSNFCNTSHLMSDKNEPFWLLHYCNVITTRFTFKPLLVPTPWPGELHPLIYCLHFIAVLRASCKHIMRRFILQEGSCTDCLFQVSRWSESNFISVLSYH